MFKYLLDFAISLKEITPIPVISHLSVMSSAQEWQAFDKQAEEKKLIKIPLGNQQKGNANVQWTNEKMLNLLLVQENAN